MQSTINSLRFIQSFLARVCTHIILTVRSSNDFSLSCFFLLGRLWPFTASGPVRRNLAALSYSLYQTGVIEIYQGRNGNVVLLDVVVVKDGLDCLLHLC